MFDTWIEDKYNINSIESCEMLMFYSKVFDVSRPKFMFYSFIDLFSVCVACICGPVQN